jgi:proline dehydrogenase
VEVDASEALGSGDAGGSASSRSASTGPPPHKCIVEEILRSIDVAADFEDSLRGASRATAPYHSLITGDTSPEPLPTPIDNSRGMWVAIKLTAMLPSAHALINFSKHITSARGEMRARHRESISDGSEIPYDRLLRINMGKESVQPESIPFPGSPLPLDMDIIHSLEQKARDNAPSMTPQDIQDIYELYNDLIKICERAQDRGVRLLMDAEYRSVAFNF